MEPCRGSPNYRITTGTIGAGDVALGGRQQTNFDTASNPSPSPPRDVESSPGKAARQERQPRVIGHLRAKHSQDHSMSGWQIPRLHLRHVRMAAIIRALVESQASQAGLYRHHRS